MAESPLSFPDAPRAALDSRLVDLVAIANDVLATQGRLRTLLRANQAIVTELDLPTVLRRIVESAVEVSGARYGALGVIGERGDLEQFIHVGMDAELADRIGHLPRGEGVLGALIAEPEPIRLHRLSEDARSVGFPAAHPPMGSFLGVPVRVRGTVYGNLYLTESDKGDFTAEDEQLVTSLATTAGFAIENARLYSETRRRQAWASASAEVTARLLSGGRDEAIALIAERLVTLADADVAFVLLYSADHTRFVVSHVHGSGAVGRQGVELPTAGSLSEHVIASGRADRYSEQRLRELGIDSEFGPMLGVPLESGTGDTFGTLLVGRRPGAHPFTDADVEMCGDFAGRAGVALALAAARADRERVILFEDRGRIARDLHDRVIQELFGTGLQLQAALGSIPDGAPHEQVDAAITNLDAAIQQIRTVIFALTARDDDRRAAGRRRILDLVGSLGDRLGVDPALTFIGSVDQAIDDALTEDVLAVVSETVTNAVKHAEASDITVRVSAQGGALVVEVANNGRAFVDSGRRSGLDNLRRRAVDRGGTMRLERSTDDRTVVVWEAPALQH